MVIFGNISTAVATFDSFPPRAFTRAGSSSRSGASARHCRWPVSKSCSNGST